MYKLLSRLGLSLGVAAVLASSACAVADFGLEQALEEQGFNNPDVNTAEQTASVDVEGCPVKLRLTESGALEVMSVGDVPASGLDEVVANPESIVALLEGRHEEFGCKPPQAA